jgi:hypothetical protein
MLPCNRADTGCVASMGQYYLTGNGADFAMVFKLENICGTDVGSKANDGGASRWCSFPHDGGFLHRRASWPQTSIEKVLFDVEYSRVLVFQGGVIECSSRMKRKFQVRFLEGWPPAMGAGYSAEQMQTLASVVNPKGAEDARRSFCSGHGGFYLLRHGQYNTAGVQRAPKLPDMSNQRNRVNPYRSPQTWGRKP